MSSRPAPRPTSAQLARLRRADPALGAALRRVDPYPGFPDPRHARLTHFDHLARSIVYQQLAGKAAATIWRRFAALGDGARPPRPPAVLGLSDAALRGAGLSGNKAAAIRDLARRVIDGELRLRGLGRLPDEAVIERLVAVRGIGVWSAQMFLIFRLGRLDVMPATDLGVREGLRRLDGLDERPPPAAVLERAEGWAPLRSVAAWTLWRLTEE